MSIFKGAGITISSGKKGEKPPRGGILFAIFGEGTNLSNFAPLLEALDEETLVLLSSVAVRLSVINKLQNSSSYPMDAEFIPLQLYLLCTCIDTLSNPNWLTFTNWLNTKKEKYDIQERNKLFTKILDEIEDIKNIQEYKNTIFDLHDEYLLHYGISKKFGQFFLNLDDFLKEYTASTYMIIQGNKNYLKPEVRKEWLDKNTDDKLLEIAKYFYEYRRNKFTHSGRTYSSRWGINFQSPKEALDTRPYKPSGGGFINFWTDRSPQKSNDVDLYVYTQHDEVFLLTNIILLYCRSLIGLSDDQEFLRKREARFHHMAIITKIVNDLEINWKTYKFYSIKWMAYEYSQDREFGMPVFYLEWLKAALELDYSDYGIPETNIIQDTKAVIRLLEALNKEIDNMNNEFPPLYIRNRDSELKNEPEDYQGKEKAKIQLFDDIQSLTEFHQVRFLLPNLLGLYQRLLIEVPDQKGGKFYSMSKPDYYRLT